MMSLVVVNRPTQKTFLKSRFVIFKYQKYVKKGYIEMRKKIYLETLKKSPGSVNFPLLMGYYKIFIRIFGSIFSHIFVNRINLNI